MTKVFTTVADHNPPDNLHIHDQQVPVSGTRQRGVWTARVPQLDRRCSCISQCNSGILDSSQNAAIALAYIGAAQNKRAEPAQTKDANDATTVTRW